MISPTPSPTPTAEPTSPEAATLVVVLPTVPPIVDTGKHATDNGPIVGGGGGTLVDWDVDQMDGLGCNGFDVRAVKPALAESWTESPEDGYIEFKLREDAVSPFGNHLTSQDVLFTFERARELNPVFDFVNFGIARYADEPIEVMDEHTFRLHLSSPSAMDLAALTWYAPTILDSVEVQKHATNDDPWAEEWLATNTAHYGPWQVSHEDFIPESQVHLRPNPNYWGPRGNITEVLIRAIPESTTRVQLLLAGDAEYTWRLALSEYESLQQADEVEVAVCIGADRVPLILNHAIEPFNDPRIRKAVSLAIDRQAIADGPFRGFATPSTTGLSAIYDVPNEAVTYEYDPDQARQLLAQAERPQGFSADLTWSVVRPGAEAEQIAILLQSQLGDVGIDVTLQQKLPADFNEDFNGGNYQMMLYLEPPAIPDAYFAMSLYNLSTSGLNTHGYHNELYDELAEAIRQELDADQRSDLLRQASDLIVEDNPYVYLVDQQRLYAYSSRIEVFQFTPDGITPYHPMLLHG